MGKLAVSKLVATSLVAAVALPMALLMAASLIDTPWAVAMDRAMKARSFAPPLPSHPYAPQPPRKQMQYVVQSAVKYRSHSRVNECT